MKRISRNMDKWATMYEDKLAEESKTVWQEMQCELEAEKLMAEYECHDTAYELVAMIARADAEITKLGGWSGGRRVSVSAIMSKCFDEMHTKLESAINKMAEKRTIEKMEYL